MRGLRDDGLALGPDLSFDLEGEDVTERDTGIVKTTVTSLDVELSVVKSAASIDAWAGSVNGGLFVVLSGNVTKSQVKSETLSNQRVVESDSWAGITSEHEEAVIPRSGDGNVLISSGAPSWETRLVKIVMPCSNCQS